MKKRILYVLPVILVAFLCFAFAACSPTATTHKVTYSAGVTNFGGTAPTEGDHAEGEKFTLAENTFTVDGSTFEGWQYGGELLLPGAEFTMPNSDVNFVAKWNSSTTNNKHSVTFTSGVENNTGVTGDAALINKSYAKGETVEMPECPFIREGYVFTGWRIVGTTDKTYAAHETYRMEDKDVTFEAVWRVAQALTVTFEKGTATSGDVPDAINTFEGSVIQLPNIGDLVKTNYEFAGWKVKGDSDSTLYQAGASYRMGTVNVTFEAQWKLAVKVEGVWTNCTIDADSKPSIGPSIGGEQQQVKYVIYIKEVDGGILFFATRHKQDNSLLPSNFYNVHFAAKSGDDQYAFSHVNGDITDNVTISFTAEETNGTVSYKLTVVCDESGTSASSSSRGSLTSNTVAAYDAAKQATVPKTGTYYYLHSRVSDQATLYQLEFKANGATYSVSTTEEPEPVKSNVSVVVFDEYLALLNSSNECLAVLGEKKDGGTVSGYNIWYPESSGQGLLTTEEKKLPDNSLHGPENATLLGTWGGKNKGVSYKYIITSADTTSATDVSADPQKILATYISSDDGPTWTVELEKKEDNHYRSEKKVRYSNLYVIEISFDTENKVLNVDLVYEYMSQDQLQSAVTSNPCTTWESTTETDNRTTVNGEWRNEEKAFSLGLYGDLIRLDEIDESTSSSSPTLILKGLFKKNTDGEYTHVDDTNGNNSDKITYSGNVVTLTLSGDDDATDGTITLDSWSSWTYAKKPSDIKTETYYSKKKDDKTYTLQSYLVTTDYLYIVNKEDGSDSEPDLQELLTKKTEAAAEGDAETETWESNGSGTNKTTLTIDKTNFEVKLKKNGTDNSEIEYYMLNKSANFNGVWTDEESQYKLKLEISDGGSGAKSVKITQNGTNNGNTNNEQTVEFKKISIYSPTYEGTIKLNGKDVKVHLGYSNYRLTLLVLKDGKEDFDSEENFDTIIFYKWASSVSSSSAT